MSKSILLSRAVATATAVLGACLLACALQAALASPAYAFTPSSQTGGESTPLNLTTSSGSSHPTSTGGASLTRTIVGLAIVIAVIWGLAWVLKQVKAGKGGRDAHPSSAGLASIAALTLGSGRTVHLVRAGSDYVLLGSTEHGLAPIHRYTEEEAREAGLPIDDPVRERSRIVSVAGQLVAGAGRALSQGGYATRSGFPEPARLPRQTGFYGEEGPYGQLPDQSLHSPVVGPRPDPMRAPAPPGGLLERLREMTVRR